MAVPALAMSVGQGIFSAIGASQSASAQAAADRYKAAVARNNAITEEQNVQYAALAGQTRVQANDLKERALQGQIEAAQGASGIDTNSPTSIAVRDSAHQVGRLDSMQLMQDAILQSRSARARETSALAESQLDTQAASNAEAAGTIGVFSSLIGGASSFSDKWMRYQNAGVPGFGSAF